MPYIAYEDWSPRPNTLALVNKADEIATSYAAQGYSLTLRQLYYRFVASDIIPNTQQSYNKLGTLVSRARMAGMIDWNHIEDRTRVHHEPTTWDKPSSIMRGALHGYAEDLWFNQRYRPEVWVEKDALVDVVGQAADRSDVPYFSCRGYTSQSAMWRAGERMVDHLVNGQLPVIFHLGDHDPSGMDMTRDIFERLNTFIGSSSRLWDKARENGYEEPWHWAQEALPDAPKNYGSDMDRATPYFAVNRIALNMNQVEEYDPPPNPAKLTDSRAEDYVWAYGYQSWELDALEPQVLNSLITNHILEVRDPDLWHDAYEKQEERRGLIEEAVELVKEKEELV